MFTNEFIKPYPTKNPQFRNKYRKADVLLIDDIHFLQKRLDPGGVVPIQHPVRGQQLVFTCDRPINN